jgi:glucose-1-phosphate adenylyltransferase
MDLRRILVYLMAGGKGQRLDPLTRDLPKPAIPFGGIYRLIDFTLSNCLNSLLRKILILVQYKSATLIRHIRDGWNIYFSPALGEYIEAIPPQYSASDQWYSGTADAVYQNLYFAEKEDPEYLLILAGDHVYKMDYRHLLAFHEAVGADLTVGAVEVPAKDSSEFGVLKVDENNRVIDFFEKPKQPHPIPENPEICLASMGIYVFRREVAFKALYEDAQDHTSSHDFGRDIICKMIDRFKVYAFSFIDENKKEAKYWRDVGTIDAYFNANMDLAFVTPFLNLYDEEWPIRTAPIQAPPPKFVFAQDNRAGIALDSLISPGCIISGGRVQNAVLSPHVRINSYSQVTESILFEGVQIGRYAKIRRAIVDEGVVIPEGMQIGYNPRADAQNFAISQGGIVVVPKGWGNA